MRGGVIEFVVRLDRLALAAADQAILWIWNALEIRKQQVVRLLLLAWVVMTWIYHVAQHKQVVGAIIALTLLLVLAVTELYAGLASPRMQNAHSVASREKPVSRLARIGLVLLAVYDVVERRGVACIGIDAVVIAQAFITLALVPEDPPQRRRQETSGRLRTVRAAA